MKEETKSMLDKIMLQKFDVYHERYVFVVNPITKDKLQLGREYKYCDVFIDKRLPEDNIYFIPHRELLINRHNNNG
jgi:hypothetical protein